MFYYRNPQQYRDKIQAVRARVLADEAAMAQVHEYAANTLSSDE